MPQRPIQIKVISFLMLRETTVAAVYDRRKLPVFSRFQIPLAVVTQEIH